MSLAKLFDSLRTTCGTSGLSAVGIGRDGRNIPTGQVSEPFRPIAEVVGLVGIQAEQLGCADQPALSQFGSELAKAGVDAPVPTVPTVPTAMVAMVDGEYSSSPVGGSPDRCTPAQRTSRSAPQSATESCRHCGEQVSWHGPGGLAFADSAVAHLTCYEQAELERLHTATKQVVAAPDAQTDEAELMVRGIPLP